MSRHACKACIHLSVLQRTAALGLAAALAACSSTPQPTEQLDAARAAVSQAQPVAVRDGGPELKTAQAKLARAEDAMQRGDYVDARIFAEQAEVDARYAWTLAENARLQRAAAEVDQSVKVLRGELDRRTK
jgi:chromosome segregation ATPase